MGILPVATSAKENYSFPKKLLLAHSTSVKSGAGAFLNNPCWDFDFCVEFMHSCCVFMTVAPVSSRDVISWHSSTLYITSSSILSSFSSAAFAEPSSVKGGCFTGPLVKDFFSLDFYEAVSQAVIPVLTEGGSAFQLTHEFIRGST